MNHQIFSCKLLIISTTGVVFWRSWSVCLLPGIRRDHWMGFKGLFTVRKEAWDVLSDNFRKLKKQVAHPLYS